MAIFVHVSVSVSCPLDFLLPLVGKVEHMQITDTVLLQPGLPSIHPTNSVKGILLYTILRLLLGTSAWKYSRRVAVCWQVNAQDTVKECLFLDYGIISSIVTLNSWPRLKL